MEDAAAPIILVLYSEPDDPFGEQYQADMQRIWKELQANGLQTLAPETKMPSPAAGGGWVTDYLLPIAGIATPIITAAITPIIENWSKRGGDHHVRLKMGDLQVMANSKEEAEEELTKLIDLQKKQLSESKNKKS